MRDVFESEFREAACSTFRDLLSQQAIRFELRSNRNDAQGPIAHLANGRIVFRTDRPQREYRGGEQGAAMNMEGEPSSREMPKLYKDYLSKKLVEGNPREAHLFALGMKHRGVTFGLPIREIVLMLEGGLPAYWPV